MSKKSRWIWPFELLEKIGSGGMGVVYRARFVKNDRIVAVKLLPSDVTDVTTLERFRRELDVLKELRHPHIVYCFGGLCEDKQQFYAMEYVEGGTVADVLKKKGSLRWQQAVEYAIQVASALEYAHERGVVHRDVKPGNFLLTPNGKVKLSDFGLASVVAARNLTAADRTMGTIRYMAPEQIAGETIRPETDLYALGCSLFEMIVGHTPFRGQTHAATMQLHLTKEAPRLSEYVDGIPVALDDLVADMLRKRPDERPPSAGEVVRRLREINPAMTVKLGKGARGGNTPTTVALPETTIARPAPTRASGTHSTLLQGAIVCVALLSMWILYLLHAPIEPSPAGQLWVRTLKTGQSRDLRAEAADALGKLGVEYAGVLESALRDPEPQVRSAAIDALAEIGDPARPMVPRLKKVQQTDPEPDVRHRADVAVKKILASSSTGDFWYYIALVVVAAGGAAGVWAVRRTVPTESVSLPPGPAPRLKKPKRVFTLTADSERS